MTFISRRDLLKRVGTGAVALGALEADARPVDAAIQTAAAVKAVKREPLQSFTSTEADLMEAILTRLIPTDEHGPGAVDCGALRYIDRGLASGLSTSRQAYTAGLAALERYAQSSRGAAFAKLSPTDQDSLLIDVETGAATGFNGSSAAFFAMLLGHTHQGMFGDPYYGGNANFAGWDLLRYPGVRTMVSAADQQALEARQLKPNHRSAYDYESFTKASHGD